MGLGPLDYSMWSPTEAHQAWSAGWASVWRAAEVWRLRARASVLRDFDETLRGPFEWDVKRYLASLVVLARDNDLSDSTARRAVESALRSYRGRMSHYASAGVLEIWYDLVTADDLLQQVFEPEERERLWCVLTSGPSVVPVQVRPGS